MTATYDFPTTDVEMRYLLVASDYARSLAFYRDVLGAKVARQISDVLCLLSLGGSELLLTVGGGPTQDKPTVTFAPPIDPNTVSSELNIRVPDCVAAYEVLRSRGAQFLTPPVDWGYEVRAFLRDPDGHLIELTQSGQQRLAGEHVSARLHTPPRPVRHRRTAQRTQRLKALALAQRKKDNKCDPNLAAEIGSIPLRYGQKFVIISAQSY